MNNLVELGGVLGPPRERGHFQCSRGGGGGVGLVWVNASPGRPDPQSAQLSLRDPTGLGAPGCRGLKACQTADSPRTPRWPGDTAVPVCVVCALLGCLWV